MPTAMKWARFVGGCATAGAVALAVASATPVRAAGGKGGGLIVQNINVAKGSGVAANQIVEITFNAPVDPASVSPATILVRGRNATDKGFTKQVFGSTQVVGNIVRFFPRLPTHLRDASGKFFATGTPQDDATANSGFQPSTKYQVTVVGRPSLTAITSTAGKVLRKSQSTDFRTAAAAPPEALWTAQSYTDQPPPQFSFSNPPDSVPRAASQYTTHGGTQDVPNQIIMSLFCTKVPLAPSTARIAGNVEMTMLARKGDYSLRRPVQGTVFVEQNFDTTLLAFQPRVSLADVGTYQIRVGKGVKDLTERYDFQPNIERDRLNRIYSWLASARILAPGVPVAQLIDPEPIYVQDWPALQDADGNDIPGAKEARGVLKTNILALGDKYPDEIDPRVMAMFTTRDEPASSDSVAVEFTRTENLFDSALSSGTVDSDVPGAAAAVFTAAAGSVILGDLVPVGSQTISADSFALGEMNYRNVVVPQGVTITFTGTRPATLKCLTITVNGTIRADGSAGVNCATGTIYSQTIASKTNKAGGPGGPGGGRGGGSVNSFGATGSYTAQGSGVVGNDVNLTLASAAAGGRGGLGGTQCSGQYYSNGGGGGGGGARTPGTGGSNAGSPYASWNGLGGAGGAAATGNDALSPLVGGAGGGAGGNGGYMYPSYLWGEPGGSGGGGGGAILIQTSGVLNVGTTGLIAARGGDGGQGTGYTGTVWTSAPGGGGGGGSILVRTARGFNFASAANAFSVTGGKGGPLAYTYSSTGGNGGSGFIRLEDPNGGVAVPGGTQGTYLPMGAGVPSYVYTKWADLGVAGPRFVGWSSGDVATFPQNDAIYVQVQATSESTKIFGTPDTSAIKASDQTSLDTKIMSQWTPIKVHDKTGVVGGAFTASLGAIPGYPTVNPPDEYASFDISALNGKGYRFVRFRVYFQLDSTQTVSSPLPYVDRIVTRFQFNF